MWWNPETYHAKFFSWNFPITIAIKFDKRFPKVGWPLRDIVLKNKIHVCQHFAKRFLIMNGWMKRKENTAFAKSERDTINDEFKVWGQFKLNFNSNSSPSHESNNYTTGSMYFFYMTSPTIQKSFSSLFTALSWQVIVFLRKKFSILRSLAVTFAESVCAFPFPWRCHQQESLVWIFHKVPR